jgi:hypothetical protein
VFKFNLNQVLLQKKRHESENVFFVKYICIVINFFSNVLGKIIMIRLGLDSFYLFFCSDFIKCINSSVLFVHLNQTIV